MKYSQNSCKQQSKVLEKVDAKSRRLKDHVSVGHLREDWLIIELNLMLATSQKAKPR